MREEFHFTRQLTCLSQYNIHVYIFSIIVERLVIYSSASLKNLRIGYTRSSQSIEIVVGNQSITIDNNRRLLSIGIGNR